MLGHWPVGTRPLGALKRQGTGPVFARLIAAGFSAVALTATAQARSTVTSAGNGAASFTSFNGRGVLASAGIGAMAPVATAQSRATTSSSGTGNTSLVLSAQSRSVLSSNGTAVFVSTMTAKVSSTVTMQGSSSFGGSDLPGSAISFGGFGVFTAVSYAFFDDAEKAGPRQELRVVYVPVDPDRFAAIISADVLPEARTTFPATDTRVAVAPWEDRVYYVKSKPATPAPPNRRRVL